MAPPAARLRRVPTVAELDALLTKNISEICPCQYTAANINHCAHFVSHVMGYQFGYTCFAQTGKGSREQTGNIRVQEIFPECRSVGTWDSKPAEINAGLAFITKNTNVDLNRKFMANVPQKHIGIFIENTIWHYSNTRDQVVSMPPSTFRHHYSGSGITVYYGEFPL